MVCRRRRLGVVENWHFGCLALSLFLNQRPIEDVDGKVLRMNLELEGIEGPETCVCAECTTNS